MAKNYVFLSTILLLAAGSTAASGPDKADNSIPSWYRTVAQAFFGAFKGSPSALVRVVNGLRGAQTIEGPMDELSDRMHALPKTVVFAQSVEHIEQPREIFGYQVSEELFGYRLPAFATKIDGPSRIVQCELVDPVQAAELDIPVVTGDYVDVITGMPAIGSEIDQDACAEKKHALLEVQQSLKGRLSALGTTFKRWVTGQDAHVGLRDATGIGRLLALYTTLGVLIGIAYLSRNYCSGDDSEHDEPSVVG